VKDGKELSYMSALAYALLRDIAGICCFVPVTTRSLEQYQRINFGFKPEFALVNHGAVLLINGDIDSVWSEGSQNELSNCTNKISVYQTLLSELEPLIYDIRAVDNWFIFCKSDNPDIAVEVIAKIIDTELFGVCSVHNKVYLLPRTLTKGKAVKHLANKLNADIIISAGDSYLDLTMLEITDTAIVPQAFSFSNEKFTRVDSEDFALSVLREVQRVICKTASSNS
jgi:hydroxymethylpyrimidine pyrophosphatase-like HAD family hydrolase